MNNNQLKERKRGWGKWEGRRFVKKEKKKTEANKYIYIYIYIYI